MHNTLPTRYTTLAEVVERVIIPAIEGSGVVTDARADYDVHGIAREAFAWRINAFANSGAPMSGAFEQVVTTDDFWKIVERHERHDQSAAVEQAYKLGARDALDAVDVVPPGPISQALSNAVYVFMAARGIDSARDLGVDEHVRQQVIGKAPLTVESLAVVADKLGVNPSEIVAEAEAARARHAGERA